MSEAAIPPLVLIAIAAVLAPIVSEQTRGLRIPSVVIELIFGIILGPTVLNLAHPNSVVDALSDFGLTFLMFQRADQQQMGARPGDGYAQAKNADA